jgi:thermitase
LSGGYYYWQQGWGGDNNTNNNKLVLQPTADGAPTIVPSDVDADGEVFIRLKKGYKIEALDLLMRRFELSARNAFEMGRADLTDLDEVLVLDLPEGKIRALPALLEALHKHAAVDMVEVNETVSLNDPAPARSNPAPAPDQPRVNDPEIIQQWAYFALNFNEFYELIETKKIRPRKKVRLAIIDTGIDGTHEDLAAHFLVGKPAYGIDPHGHGTHCAGIAAAVCNNQKGIASLALNGDFVEIVSIRVFDESGRTSQERIIDGMIEAVDMGCTVLSMSLGGPINTETQFLYSQAVEYAQKRGAIVVVAAGNESMDAAERAPAGVKGVITVAALNSKLQKADFSNDVSRIGMAICAPGVDIYSTMPANEYEYLSGTSMATPYVASLVALLKAIRPQLSTEQVYKILNGTGKVISPSTGKLIQPAAALRQVLK